MSKKVKVENKVIESATRAIEEMKEEKNDDVQVSQYFDEAFPVIDGSDKELVVIGNYALVKPYGYNPYRPKATESGLLLEDPGIEIDPNTGEMSQQNVEIVLGKVTHVGPKCEMLKVGDDVYYRNFSANPIPFMGKGLRFVNEQQVFVIVR